MVVGQGKPVAKRRVIIAGAGNVKIIRVEILRADGWLFFAAGQRRRRQATQQKQTDIFAPFHVRKMRSAQHRRRNNDADADDHRRRDDGGGNIFVFDDFALQVARCAFVENFVADDGGGNADAGEN